MRMCTSLSMVYGLFKPRCFTHVTEKCFKETALFWGGTPDTFDPVCFLYASLSHISKAEIVKRTLLQTDNFFQSSDKKVTCLTWTQIKVLGISKKQRINSDIFVNVLKKKTSIFYTLKQYFFLISFCGFWRKAILLSIIAHIK